MPRFGIGTFNVPEDSTACDAVAFALANGYRHIDTAQDYRVNDELAKPSMGDKVMLAYRKIRRELRGIGLLL